LFYSGATQGLEIDCAKPSFYFTLDGGNDRFVHMQEFDEKVGDIILKKFKTANRRNG
jgi:hypothetical protein